jgi:hypothetical protein
MEKLFFKFLNYSFFEWTALKKGRPDGTDKRALRHPVFISIQQ